MKKEEMVQYAYKNTQFYNKKYQNLKQGSEWEELPISTKAEIAHAGISIISRQYFSEIGGDKILKEFTSGSCGESLELYTSLAEQNTEAIPLWNYRKKYYGIFPSDPFCFFFTAHISDENVPYKYIKKGMGISKEYLCEANISQIYQAISSFQPKWLLLQPSIAMTLARYVVESGVPVISSMKYIEVTGEVLSERERLFIENVFEVNIASQYGCNEVGSIAYQCPYGNHHIMKDNVFVETTCNNEIIVTSRHNKIMPFIRYNIGDIGYIENSTCVCGNDSAILRLQGTRKDDKVLLESGEIISANIFRQIFFKTAEIIDGRIYQYGVVQTGTSEFEISFATNETPENIERIFEMCVSETILKGSIFKYHYYTYMFPNKKTGKLKFFTNLLL